MDLLLNWYLQWQLNKFNWNKQLVLNDDWGSSNEDQWIKIHTISEVSDLMNTPTGQKKNINSSGPTFPDQL